MALLPDGNGKSKGKTQATRDRIKCLVEDEIQQQPYAFDGQIWEARSQQSWCDQLGVSVATFRRGISQPPFVRRCAQIGGRNVTLIRLGEDIKTERDYRNIMSKIWRDQTGRRSTTKHEFGCICGLVHVWPEGQGPKLLKVVLDRWSEFMVGVKLAAAANGQSFDRYLGYPSLPVIRRYHQVALEMARMDHQTKRVSDPEGVAGVSDSI